jgi:hypothetical protein
MKKLLFLISINLLFTQSIDAIICYKQSNSQNTILFNNFLMFDLPNYLNIRITNNPESVEIANFNNTSFVIESNFSKNYFVVTDSYNRSFLLPFNVKIEQNENFLIVTNFNADLNEISNIDKIDTYIELLKGHKSYLDFSNGLDFLNSSDLPNLIDGFLKGTYNKNDNPYVQHATEIAIGQMYFFDQEPFSNDPKRLEKALGLLKKASKKTFTFFELSKAQICLGLIYLSDRYSTNNNLNNVKKALDLFTKASKMGDSLIQFVAKGLIKIAQDKINTLLLIEDV